MGRIKRDEGRLKMYSKTKERVRERGGNERISNYQHKPLLPQVYQECQVYQVNMRRGSSKLCGRDEEEDEAILHLNGIKWGIWGI